MNADYWIKNLNLIPHPEGGFYKETYQSDFIIGENELMGTHGGSRQSSSLIYYLLKNDECSHFHRLKSDELWIYNDGETLIIYIIEQSGSLRIQKLGKNIERGEKLQILVPANCWFAAELMSKNSYSLLSCMVTPGFVFLDFELAIKEQLIQEYKQHETLISRLTL